MMDPPRDPELPPVESADIVRRSAVPPPHAPSAFMPIFLLVLAVGGWGGFQLLQLYREQQTLMAMHETQQKQVDDAAKLRASLEAIARDTAALAKDGNANAKLVVDELRKRGVNINPDAPAGGTPLGLEKR